MAFAACFLCFPVVVSRKVNKKRYRIALERNLRFKIKIAKAPKKGTKDTTKPQSNAKWANTPHNRLPDWAAIGAMETNWAVSGLGLVHPLKCPSSMFGIRASLPSCHTKSSLGNRIVCC